MVVPVIVSNPKTETCDLTSGMIVIRIKGNIINLKLSGNFEICITIGQPLDSDVTLGLYVPIQVVFAFLLI